MSWFLEISQYQGKFLLSKNFSEFPSEKSGKWIYRYVTNQLGRVYKHAKWVPHLLSNDQKMKRVEECKKLVDILQKCKNNGWHNIITGDQSWFNFGYGVDGAWLYDEEKAPINDGSKIQIKKIMLTVIWGVHGIYLIDALPEGESFKIADL